MQHLVLDLRYTGFIRSVFNTEEKLKNFGLELVGVRQALAVVQRLGDA